LTIHNKQWHNFAASEARALGDIISESTGSIISECPGDFIGIRIVVVELDAVIVDEASQSFSARQAVTGHIGKLAHLTDQSKFYF